MVPQIIRVLLTERVAAGRLTMMRVEELSEWSRSVLLISEAARFLDCDPRTVTKAIKSGTITSFTIGKKTYIPIKPFRQLLEEGSNGQQ